MTLLLFFFIEFDHIRHTFVIIVAMNSKYLERADIEII